MVKAREIWPLIPATLYLLAFLIIVLVYLTGLSLSYGTGTEFVFPTFRPIMQVFANPEFADALANTIWFVMIGTPLELLAGLVLALLLYKVFFGVNIIRSIFLIPLAIPALVTATLLFILFDFPGGHINDLLMGKYFPFPQIIGAPINWRGSKFFALSVSMLGKIWRDMPISMLILLSGLNAIDPELFDAAKSMGAGFLQRLRRIILPLILPSISAVLLLRSIEVWKEFIFPFILAGRHPLLGTLIESLYNNWGYSHEAAVVALILVFCIVLTSLLIMKTMDIFTKLMVRR